MYVLLVKGIHYNAWIAELITEFESNNYGMGLAEIKLTKLI